MPEMPHRAGPKGPGPSARVRSHPQLFVYAATMKRCTAAKREFREAATRACARGLRASGRDKAKAAPRRGVQKARPLPNLTPSPLNVVNVHCSVFKAYPLVLAAWLLGPPARSGACNLPSVVRGRVHNIRTAGVRAREGLGHRDGAMRRISYPRELRNDGVLRSSHRAGPSLLGGNRALLPHDASGVLSSSRLRSHTLPCPSTTTLSLMRSGFWSPFR
jgi:hypothetical protein